MKTVQQEQVSEQRLALVIGNGAYRDAPLTNPPNDAKALSRTLRTLGFAVIEKINVNQEQFEAAISDFGARLRRGGVGLFYYAGHGVQVNGQNYLIPIGAMINKETEAKYKAVDAGLVLAQMEDAGNRVNIVILDACRNNPFARSWRSSTRGLATLDAPKGTIISYATAPGKVASDGDQGNGLYTERLLYYIKQQGLPIEEVFKNVRRDVQRRTNDTQTPWEQSSLTGDFYFNPDAKVIDSRPAPSGELPANVKNSDLPSISNSIGMELVLVQPGTFQMGSGPDPWMPIHAVTISKPFYIGKYEVTQKQWHDVMGGNRSFYLGDNRPVSNVSWDDAQDFIRKLNEKEGTAKYRLPTEAEWEFAAKGGTQSHGYMFAGSSNVDDVAVFDQNSGGETKPVGSKQPNELGIYDMSGNVKEWCSDWYGPYGTATRTDPDGPTSGKYRVLRGGGFYDWVRACCVAYHHCNLPAPRYDDQGFRCVRDP